MKIKLNYLLNRLDKTYMKYLWRGSNKKEATLRKTIRWTDPSHIIIAKNVWSGDTIFAVNSAGAADGGGGFRIPFLSSILDMGKMAGEQSRKLWELWTWLKYKLWSKRKQYEATKTKGWFWKICMFSPSSLWV